MRTLFLFILLVGSEAMAVVPQLPFSVQKELIKLQTDLSLSGSREEKFQLVEQSIKDLKDYRDQATLKKASDMGRLDLMIAVMDSLPNRKEFQKSECVAYESNLVEEFEPMAEETPNDPSVLYGWDTLQRLCK